MSVGEREWEEVSEVRAVVGGSFLAQFCIECYYAVVVVVAMAAVAAVPIKSWDGWMDR